jgi:hypothetical protein
MVQWRLSVKRIRTTSHLGDREDPLYFHFALFGHRARGLFKAASPVGFDHLSTRTYERLLGPCFKTGELSPFCQHLQVFGVDPRLGKAPKNTRRHQVFEACPGRAGTLGTEVLRLGEPLGRNKKRYPAFLDLAPESTYSIRGYNRGNWSPNPPYLPRTLLTGSLSE